MQVKELSSLVLALSQTRLIFFLYEYHSFKHFLDEKP